MESLAQEDGAVRETLARENEEKARAAFGDLEGTEPEKTDDWRKQLYLNLKNPLIVEDDGWGSAVSQADNRHNDLMRWAKAGNHDGIIVKSTDEIMEDDEADAVYIAFYPEQIKNVANQMPTNSADIRYSITGENNAVENEKAIRKLENEIEDINSKLDLASVDGLSEIEVRRLQNQLTKSQYELDQRNAAERKAAVRTPLQTVLDNLDNYRAIDLESIANQLTDNVWDDVETLSTEDLKSGIREILQERAGDMSPLEMQSPKFGVYVRKPSTSAGVRYSITPEFEQWYKENFGGEDLTDAQLQRRLEYAKQILRYSGKAGADRSGPEEPDGG